MMKAAISVNTAVITRIADKLSFIDERENTYKGLSESTFSAIIDFLGINGQNRFVDVIE